MSEECTHDCSSCGESCSSRIVKDAPNKDSHIKKVIGVLSGKGGVGKSMITSLLAVAMNKSGYKTAIMDADITGPSIPKAFGLTQRAMGTDEVVFPVETAGGIKVMSINLLLPDSNDPVIWRGPVLGGTVKQFWSEVVWGDIDYMFIDMPPGTGDVPLTIFQSLPLDGIFIVTSPQDLVSMIVTKAVRMAQVMDIPILGLIENMSYVLCPDCGKKIEIFGKSHLEKSALEHGLEIAARMPIYPALAELMDAGKIEDADTSILQNAVSFITAE